jgi:hypothetical protein
MLKFESMFESTRKRTRKSQRSPCMCDGHRITKLLKSQRLPTTTLACLLCNARLLLGYPLACCAVSLAVCMRFANDVGDRCEGDRGLSSRHLLLSHSHWDCRVRVLGVGNIVASI